MTDIVVLILLGVLGGWFTYRLLHRLYWQDVQATKDTQCPPHAWERTYHDSEQGVVSGGVRCTKCRRRPDGLTNGESWVG